MMGARGLDFGQGTTPFTLGRSAFLKVAAILAGLFVVVFLAIASPYHMEALYFRYFLSATLEEEFGFRLGKRLLSRGGDTGEYLVLSDITPGGALAQAGLRAGDVPLNCHHGCEWGFYAALLDARDTTALSSLRVMHADEFGKEEAQPRRVWLVSPGRHR